MEVETICFGSERGLATNWKSFIEYKMNIVHVWRDCDCQCCKIKMTQQKWIPIITVSCWTSLVNTKTKQMCAVMKIKTPPRLDFSLFLDYLNTSGQKYDQFLEKSLLNTKTRWMGAVVKTPLRLHCKIKIRIGYIYVF